MVVDYHIWVNFITTSRRDRTLESWLGFGKSSPNGPTIQVSEILYPDHMYLWGLSHWINIFNDGDSGKGVFSLILCICWCHSPCWKLSFLAFAGFQIFQPPLCCGCVRPYMIPSDNSTYGQLTDKKEQTLEVFLGHPELWNKSPEGEITINLQISQMPTFYP